MLNSELESWIEDRIQEGYTPKQIEKELRKEEWTEQEIKEAKQIAREKARGMRQTNSEKGDKRLSSASLGKRAGANIIDGLLLIVSFFILIVLDTFASNMTGISLITRFLATPIFIAVALGYFIVSEAKYGQTIGKKVLNLEVSKTSGSPISYRESVIRNLLRPVDWLPAFYMIGIIAIVSNEESKRIGDQIAGTVVVQE